MINIKTLLQNIKLQNINITIFFNNIMNIQIINKIIKYTQKNFEKIYTTILKKINIKLYIITNYNPNTILYRTIIVHIVIDNCLINRTEIRIGVKTEKKITIKSLNMTFLTASITSRETYELQETNIDEKEKIIKAGRRKTLRYGN